MKHSLLSYLKGRQLLLTANKSFGKRYTANCPLNQVSNYIKDSIYTKVTQYTTETKTDHPVH